MGRYHQTYVSETYQNKSKGQVVSPDHDTFLPKAETIARKRGWRVYGDNNSNDRLYLFQGGTVAFHRDRLGLNEGKTIVILFHVSKNKLEVLAETLGLPAPGFI